MGTESRLGWQDWLPQGRKGSGGRDVWTQVGLHNLGYTPVCPEAVQGASCVVCVPPMSKVGRVECPVWVRALASATDSPRAFPVFPFFRKKTGIYHRQRETP